jgi:glutathione S-transferase/maleylpyruvate isomerase
MITLYDIPVSSYGCKIRVVMTHKQLEWRSVPPPDGYGSPAYCKIIPAGTIPAIDQNGFRLADSEAIAEYLDEIIASPPMLPVDPQDRARIREISRFHDTRLEPLLRAYFAHVSPETRDQNFVTSNAALLQKRLDQLGQIANPAPLLFGNQLTIADCGFVASFALITTLQDILGFDLTIPEPLQAYERVLVAHPSVATESAAYYDALAGWATAKLRG